ncbi:DEAD/DEAH box helicase [Heliobacterium undosum]|uniref:DEAD/DEAH box helicase n=1 Tax=Heliomicrobium undosum TaxID=121734 RepID=A0A845L2A3_9FIRM|nr:DEAD/DEAH box helicase [Heliomicrobium undosum]MZP30702.1 DEAD/DEAH box helicase [Heliomicrobium undosum]
MDIGTCIGRYFPEQLIEKWIESDYKELLPVQVAAINQGIFDGKSILVVAPTSSGKTFVGEMMAVYYALQRKKSIYLVPFKAIAEEKYQEFSKKYGGEELGLNIRLS